MPLNASESVNFAGNGLEEDALPGGFFRRSGAFLIDAVVLAVSLFFFFYLLFVGYKVGLGAHHQALWPEQIGIFFRFYGLAAVFFLASYFFVLHCVGGQTVGKWIMDLRVVGPHGHAITCGQSVVRVVGYLVSGFFGLGFLWILCNQQKRGWHDLLAGTWVIRPERNVKEGDR